MWLFILGNLNFLFFLIAFTMRDLLWLRIFAILSSFCAVIYFYFQVEPVWVAVLWELSFFIVNTVQILILLYEKKNFFLTEEEKFLYGDLFSSLSPLQFKKLIKLAFFQDVEAGKVLIEQGKKVEELMIITKGAVSVTINGIEVAICRAGSFIGEMSLISEEPATATITSIEPTRFIAWQQDEIKHLFDKNFDIYLGLQTTINKDLLKKIKR